jgi:ABC-type transport system substrate-binding protein
MIIKIYAKNIEKIKEELEKIGIKDVKIQEGMFGNHLSFKFEDGKKFAEIYRLVGKYGGTLAILQSEEREVGAEIQEGLEKIKEIL